MRPVQSVVAVLLSLTAVASPLAAQPTRRAPAPQVDPVVVRFVSADPLTKALLPEAAKAAGTDKIEIPGFPLATVEQSVNILGVQFGYKVETRVPKTVVSLPIDDKTFTIVFDDAAPNSGKLTATAKFTNASTRTEMAIKSSLTTNLPPPPRLGGRNRSIFDAIRGGSNRDFTVVGTDLTGDLKLTLELHNGTIRVKSVDSLVLRAGKISVDDPGPVKELCDLLITGGDKVGKLFGLPEAGSIDDVATRITNRVLAGADSPLVREKLQDAFNRALGLSQSLAIRGATVPISREKGIDFSSSLTSIRTQRDGGLATSWNVGVQLRGTPAHPTLSFSSLNRPAQDPTAPGTSLGGHLNISLPFSLFDKAWFEAIQAGIFDQSLAAARDVRGNRVTGAIKIEPAGLARASAGEGSQIVIEIPARVVIAGAVNRPQPIVDQPAGSPASKKGPNTATPGRRDPVSVSADGTVRADGLADVTATVRVVAELTLSDASGLALTPKSVTLKDLRGKAMAGTVEHPIATVEADLTNRVLVAAAQWFPAVTLVERTTALGNSYAVKIDRVAVGPRYVTAALSLVRR